VLRRELEDRNRVRPNFLREARHDHVADLIGDLVDDEAGIRAHELGHEYFRVPHTRDEGAVRTEAHGAELAVGHHHRRLRSPFLTGELPRADEYDIGLERALEAVFPPAQLRQHGKVARRELVAAGIEHVGHGPLIHEHRDLSGPYDELCAILDFVLRTGKPPYHRVRRVFE